MSKEFNPPPNWPKPPEGWRPPDGWKPDPAWDPPPQGWELWKDTSESEPQRIFISYRRSDCQAQANGLYDGLRHRLSSARVFMDIDSIPPAVDFADHIRSEIEACDVVLVMIGDNWLDPLPDTGVRRLDDPDDFVRHEIESAFDAPGVRIVPVLVEGAAMPHRSDLPESIQKLARINAIELNDRRWRSDLESLASVLHDFDREKRETSKISPGPVPVHEGGVRFRDLDAGAIGEAIARMPQSFRTKDLSQDAHVAQAHMAIKDRANYHTMVGRYLANNFADLGLTAPRPATDDRGAEWAKATVAAERQDLPETRRASSEIRELSPGTVPLPVPKARRSPIGWLMVALPIVTCGLTSFVVPLWIGFQGLEARSRRRMWWLSGVLLVAECLAVGFVAAAPPNEEGVSEGPLLGMGTVGLILVVVVGVTIALVHQYRVGLPGAAEQLALRRQRSQTRQMIERNRAMAVSMRVGRPDLQREYADGGLLDLNALPEPALVEHGHLRPDEAAGIVAARARLGSFSSIEEVFAHAELSESAVATLKERAIFL
jgi:hypothetical protein